MKKGWEIKRLDEVSEVEYGTRVVNKRDGGTIYPVYGGGGATFFMDTFNRENCFIVSRFAMSKQCTRFVEGKFFLNDSGLSLKPRNQKEVLQDFLNLQMLFLNDHIYSLARGTAQKNLDVPAFRNIKISYPKSLSEQQRIVAILNEVFAAIAKAKANAEENLKNSKELFESYLHGVFENKSDGWINTTIGETCNLQTGGTPSTSKKEFYEGGTIKWLVSGDINLKVINDCEGRITELGMNSSNTKYLPVNSVLIALNGQGKTRGTVAMLRTKATCNQSLVSIFPKDEKILLPELVFSNLEGRYDEIRKMTGDGGNDRRGLNMPLIRSIKFSYPKNITEQKEIIKKLENLRAETKKLEAIYQQKINDLEELKKSVLQKAFSGELKTEKVLA